MNEVKGKNQKIENDANVGRPLLIAESACLKEGKEFETNYNDYKPTAVADDGLLLYCPKNKDTMVTVVLKNVGYGTMVNIDAQISFRNKAGERIIYLAEGMKAYYTFPVNLSKLSPNRKIKINYQNVLGCTYNQELIVVGEKIETYSGIVIKPMSRQRLTK